MSTLATTNAAQPRETWVWKLIWAVIAFLLLAIGICLLVAVSTPEHVANRDFVSYWAAGQQLIHGENPYAANRIFAIEQSVGWQGSVLIMRNPPWGLFLTLPLGTVPARGGYLFWSLFNLGAWLGSVHLIWIMNGRQKNSLHLIAYVFAPAVACFVLGQMTAFVLLGLTLFLYFHRRMPWLAGGALMLCTLKPHLLLPFEVVLLAWAVTSKAYRVMGGAAISLAICGAVPLLFNPSIYRQYAAMASTSGVRAEFIPTLSELLRIVVDPKAFWLQFLPALAACAWAGWYFHRHRENWDWHRRGPLLIVVSFAVAPYAWYFDAIILLPSILYAAYRARHSDLAVLYLLLVAADAQMLLSMQPHSAWNLWPGVAWVSWYLWAMRGSRSSPALPAGTSTVCQR